MMEFMGTCVENPFGAMGTLVNVVENHSRQISKGTFLKHCAVSGELRQDMNRYPYDYEFSKSKERLSSPRHIYFYTHSAIEHFYS